MSARSNPSDTDDSDHSEDDDHEPEPPRGYSHTYPFATRLVTNLLIGLSIFIIFVMSALVAVRRDYSTFLLAAVAAGLYLAVAVYLRFVSPARRVIPHRYILVPLLIAAALLDTPGSGEFANLDLGAVSPLFEILGYAVLALSALLLWVMAEGIYIRPPVPGLLTRVYRAIVGEEPPPDMVRTHHPEKVGGEREPATERATATATRPSTDPGADEADDSDDSGDRDRDGDTARSGSGSGPRSR